jgi:hypothetical protein
LHDNRRTTVRRDDWHLADTADHHGAKRDPRMIRLLGLVTPPCGDSGRPLTDPAEHDVRHMGDTSDDAVVERTSNPRRSFRGLREIRNNGASASLASACAIQSRPSLGNTGANERIATVTPAGGFVVHASDRSRLLHDINTFSRLLSMNSNPSGRISGARAAANAEGRMNIGKPANTFRQSLALIKLGSERDSQDARQPLPRHHSGVRFLASPGPRGLPLLTAADRVLPWWIRPAYGRDLIYAKSTRAGGWRHAS